MQYEQLAGRQARRPAEAVDRHRHGARAHRRGAAGHARQLRDRPVRRASSRTSPISTGVDADGAAEASHRVIADHLRASAFLIADGVLPSNEGRGYVLRRIMRRAMRHAELLGAREPLMWRLVPTLTREMGQAYPELIRAEALITETLKLEETRFRKTLERGLAILDEETRSAQQGDKLQRRDRVHALRHLRLSARPHAGRAACRAASASIPTRFNAAMERQREKARASWAGSGEAATETIWFAAARKSRRDRVPGLRDRERRRRGGRAGQGRQRGRRAQGGRERRGDAQPDAVLWRIRRPGRRHRHDDARTACASASPTRRRRPATCSCISARSRRARSRRRGARARCRSRAPRRHPRATIRPRICCTRRCARCSAITSRRRARWSRPTGCASISRIPSR